MRKEITYLAPPVEVTVFMALTFSFDIPIHTSQLDQATLYFPTAA